MNMRKKILFAICLVIILFAIGFGVFSLKKYEDTDKGKTIKYQSELKDKLNLTGNKVVIKIIKEDINADESKDYIVLLGEEKFFDTDTTQNNDVKKLVSKVEMYNNICVDIIDGKSNEVKRYDTKKSYGNDVNIESKNINSKSFIILSDKSTGNISLLYLQDNEIKNAISDAFGSEFNGYTINAEFNKEDETKLNVRLDNYGRDYLTKKEDVYTLDYKDTNVNKENYRLTYMANKFCEFNIEEDENKNLILVGIQNILYSNNENVDKISGKVKSKFKFNEENKLVFLDVEVIK